MLLSNKCNIYKQLVLGKKKEDMEKMTMFFKAVTSLNYLLF